MQGFGATQKDGEYELKSGFQGSRIFQVHVLSGTANSIQPVKAVNSDVVAVSCEQKHEKHVGAND